MVVVMLLQLYAGYRTKTRFTKFFNDTVKIGFLDFVLFQKNGVLLNSSQLWVTQIKQL